MPADVHPPLQRLSALAQSVWLDFLSRDIIRGGHLQELIDDDAVVGATSNPTIFQKAMTAGNAYDEVAESYIRGLERLVAEGGDPSKVVSVASFFVSRIDTEADRRLDELGGQERLKGKLAIANAKLAYQHYLQTFAGPRWQFLAGKGATTQRVLWASTSTKNPDYPDTKYVEDLIGPDTINTMPEETMHAYQDHGVPQPRLEQGIED